MHGPLAVSVGNKGRRAFRAGNKDNWPGLMAPINQPGDHAASLSDFKT